MKLLIIALVLTPAAALSASSSEFLAEFGDKHDAGAVFQKLQGMMGAAQQKLGLAERHHKKTVKKIRKEAEVFLEDESKVYGNYIRNYSADLNQATADLEEAVQEAKDGLKTAEAAPSNPNDWKDPSVEQRAKLGAEVAAAERNIKKTERRSTRQAQEAEEHGSETMEDESQKLGMKLGDMTPLVEKAKKSLEAVAEKPIPAATKKTEKKPATAPKKVDLKALESNLAAATKKNLAATTEANKKLDGFLVKQDKDVAAKAAKIQKDLETEQKAEIEKVLGKKTEAAPVKKVKAAPVKKAAPIKKVEKPKASVAPAKKVEKVAAKAAPAPVAKAESKPVAKVAAKPAVQAAVKPAAVKK